MSQAMAQAAALYAAGRLDEARAACDAILRAAPDDFWALHLAATIALRRGDVRAAVELATRALERDPRNVDVLSNRGAALRRLDRPAEALADYDRALAINPAAAPVHVNRGIALAALNRHEEALAAYDRALALQPGHLAARFHRALSALVLGDFARGLADYEARFGGAEAQAARRPLPQPLYTGQEPLAGRTVLVHAEQGLGDAVQMARYAPLLKSRGARVVFEVQAPLVGLLSTAPGIDAVVAMGASLAPFDFHVPLMSLPLALGTRPETIPREVPYLRADASRVEGWRARLPAGGRIGVAWSGNPAHVNDRNRSMPLAALAALRASGATVVALQKDVRDDEARQLRDWGWLHFGAGTADFRDTAALIACMDCVLSVDTAIAHVAGALAADVRLLLPFSPEWRWMLAREDSPWYPTMRLFRQATPGAWDPVVAQALAAPPRSGVE